ncbi:MAG: septum formation initiator family protein [candidate division Zixibacteria bacterium]|nr:septum formation initiator family protein [candidate division Zixibacteria bacterium]
MARRRKQNKPLLSPLAGGLLKRLSNTDARLRRRIVKYGFWAVSLLFVYSLMSGTYGIPRIVRLELEKRSLIEANRAQTIALIDAERIQKMLQTDPLYLERIARLKYHMTYPGEILYHYRHN